MLERRREDIAIAKGQGKFKGRKAIQYPSNLEDVYKQWKSGGITINKIMEELRLYRNIFYKLVK